MRALIGVSCLALGAAAAGAEDLPVRLPTNRAATVPLRAGTANASLTAPGTRSAVAAPDTPDTTLTPTAALLRQAETWRRRGRSDLASQALRRAVRVSPRDPEVLYRLALYAAQDNDLATAAHWLQRLRGVTNRNDNRVVHVARLTGSAAGAAAPAAEPKSSIAAASAQPGIRADDAVRPRVDSAPAQRATARAASASEPGAPARPRQDRDPGGNERALAFAALNAGDLMRAEQLFARALAKSPGDSEAAGGLGVIRLRQQRTADAVPLLTRAARGRGGERWSAALASAHFYTGLQEVRAKIAAGRAAEAERDVALLLASDFKDKTEAELALGEIMLHTRRYSEAEAAFRQVYLRNPQRQDAVAGLAESLAGLGRGEEALALIDRSLGDGDSRGLRARIERARADELKQRGDVHGAGSALAAALRADPRNPWTRYEYARFLASQGALRQAAEAAGPLFSEATADVETLQAAALYAEFAGRPEDAAAILRRIPDGERNSAVRELARRLDIQDLVVRARALQAQGRAVEGIAMLRDTARRADLPFGVRSRLAQALLDLGDQYGAAAMAATATGEPLAGDVRPGDAIGFLAVLGATGQDDAAASLLRATAQLARSSEEQAAWRVAHAAYSTQRADQLRMAGDLARSFDVLSAALAVSPRDPGLVGALARLYQMGNMPAQAAQSYDLLLQIRPDDVSVLLDAARAAAAGQQLERGARLLKRAIALRPDDAELRYELGRLEQARGRDREALKAFEQAEVLLRGARAASGAPGSQPGGVLGPNPFVAQSAGRLSTGAPPYALGPTAFAGAAAGHALVQGGIQPLPAMLPANGSDPAGSYPRALATPAFASPAQALPVGSSYAAPVGRHLTEVAQSGQVFPPLPPSGYPAPAAPHGTLPAQSSVPAQLQAPAYPGNAYPQPSAAPVPTYPAVIYPQQALPPAVTQAPGYPAGQVYQLGEGDQRRITDPTAPLAARVQSEIAAAREERSPSVEGGFAARVRSGETGSSALSELSGRATVAFQPLGLGKLSLTAQPVTISSGVPKGDGARRVGGNPLIAAQQLVNNQTVALPAQATRSETGVALFAAFDSPVLDADIGTTPVGFGKTRLSAGVALTPRLGSVELRLKAEQRPVTDSVLAYAGDRDTVTGIATGPVERRSAGAGVAIDLAAVGFYLDGSGKRFSGSGIPDNDAFEINGGLYVRPVNSGSERLQAGININYQGFDRNLRYFTLGHGGYFSPQEFVSASLPITYTMSDPGWSWSASVAPGIQSYREDAAAFFPGFNQLQSRLVSLAILDPDVQAFYPGTSQTGFGINGRLEGQYRVQRSTMLGGLLSLDTFGRYSEFRIDLYLRQLLNLGRR